MFPNLNDLADVSVAIPVGTASVERSFSHMKMTKTRLKNRLKESSLSFLMKIAIESPEKLSDKDLDDIIDIWNRKPSELFCKTVTVYSSTIEFFSHIIIIIIIIRFPMEGGGKNTPRRGGKCPPPLKIPCSNDCKTLVVGKTAQRAYV